MEIQVHLHVITAHCLNTKNVSIHASTHSVSAVLFGELWTTLTTSIPLHPLFHQSHCSASAVLLQMAVVHSNVWNCNHSCLWMGVINVLYHRNFDGQSGVCGEQSQRRTSTKWCAIIWSVWSFVIACSAECTMSNEECPPGAIIIVFINCIVDG